MKFDIATAVKKRRCNVCRRIIPAGTEHLATYDTFCYKIERRLNYCSKCAKVIVQHIEKEMREKLAEIENVKKLLQESIKQGYCCEEWFGTDKCNGCKFIFKCMFKSGELHGNKH
jgi:hypothetical protein